MNGWLWALLAGALLGAQAPPGVVTEPRGPDAYSLSYTATDLQSAEQAQRRVLQTAQRLCGDKPVQFGRYSFEGHRPLSTEADAGPRQLTVRQDLTCGQPQAASRPPGPIVERRDDQVIRRLTDDYFGALSREDFQRAYAQTSPEMHGGLSLAEWIAAERDRRTATGGSERRRLTKVTWYDNPQGADRPGTYVAVDFTASSEKTLFECGYVVWYHEGEGRFRLVRQETTQLLKAQAAEMTPAQLEEMKVMARCAS